MMSSSKASLSDFSIMRAGEEDPFEDEEDFDDEG